MADQQEILNTILLTRLNYFSLAGMLELYRTAKKPENALRKNWSTTYATE